MVNVQREETLGCENVSGMAGNGHWIFKSLEETRNIQ